jgi:hypothetical protein
MSFRAIIMATVGAGGSAVALFLPYYGLLLLGVLYFFRPSLWGYEDIVRPVLWLSVAVPIGWLVSLRVRELWRGNWWLALLLGLYVLSTLNAPFANDLSWDRLIQIAKIMVIAFIITQLCDSPARLAGFVGALLVGCAWFVKVAVFAWSAAGFSGDVRIDAGVGQGGGANYVAWVLAATFIFVLYKALHGQGRERIAAMFFAPLWLVGIVATGSRGGLLCLVAALACFLLLRRKPMVVLALAGVYLAFSYLAPESWTKRMETITLDPARMDNSSLVRYQNIQAGLKIIRHYPVFGTGLDSFPRVKHGYVGQGYIGSEDHVAHCTYIQMGSEVGLIFLSAFLMVNLFLIWRLIRFNVPEAGDPKYPLWRPQREHLEWVRVGTVCGLAATAVQMAKGDVGSMDFFWWLYAVGFVCQVMLHGGYELIPETVGQPETSSHTWRLRRISRRGRVAKPAMAPYAQESGLGGPSQEES